MLNGGVPVGRFVLRYGVKMAIDPVMGAAIGAGSNLLGGLLGQLQGNVNAGRAQDMANNQMAMQREYATTGITWRARDVMRAYGESGIHPLALLGVQGPSYTPVSVQMESNNDLGKGIAGAGQDLSRAIAATSDRDSRNAMASRFDALTTERAGLENELLRTRIASERMRLLPGAAAVGPAAPSSFPVMDGQGVNTELRSPLKFVKDDAMAYPVKPAHPSHGPMAVPSVEFSLNSDGSYSPVMSKAFKERTEDQMLPGLKHFYANTILPMINPSRGKAPFPAHDGYHWYIDHKGDWHHRRNAAQRLKGHGWRD